LFYIWGVKRMFAVFFLCQVFITQAQTLIPEAQKVKSAFESLSANPQSKELQQSYVSAFPSETKTFLNIFHSEEFDQLYDSSHVYIYAFADCSDMFPAEVIDKSIDIGKNLVWDADAVSYLIHVSVMLATEHVQLFVEKYRLLTSKEQNNLLALYADVENHDAYSEYQILINVLYSRGENDIAQKLNEARAIRKMRNDH
jgi:hypothetical protein